MAGEEIGPGLLVLGDRAGRGGMAGGFVVMVVSLDSSRKYIDKVSLLAFHSHVVGGLGPK